MNWVSSVAMIVVAVGIVLRLSWWAFGRSHRLAIQRQTPVENPTELSKTEHGTPESELEKREK